MSQASSVVLVSVAAEAAYASLSKNASPKDLHDMGHGSVELLREVLTQLEIGEKHPELKQTAEAMGLLLLLLKGLLLGWDCEDFPKAIFELPLQRLPKTWPNQAWKLKHPCPQVLADEVKASLRFLDNQPTLSGEPWEWLADSFRSIQTVLE